MFLKKLFGNNPSYLDEFTDEEIKEWINGKKNKIIDSLINKYLNYSATKTTNDKPFIGFRKRDKQVFRMLSPDELVDELRLYMNRDIISSRYKEHLIATLECNTIQLKERTTFNEYSTLYQKARELEKQKMYEEAIDIYLDIINRYSPSGSAYYERPCILLEKLKRYDEAINICNVAITRTEQYDFNFPVDDFKKRLDRLNRNKK